MDIEIDANDLVTDLFEQLEAKNRELTFARMREKALQRKIADLERQLAELQEGK